MLLRGKATKILKKNCSIAYIDSIDLKNNYTKLIFTKLYSYDIQFDHSQRSQMSKQIDLYYYF